MYERNKEDSEEREWMGKRERVRERYVEQMKKYVARCGRGVGNNSTKELFLIDLIMLKCYRGTVSIGFWLKAKKKNNMPENVLTSYRLNS